MADNLATQRRDSDDLAVGNGLGYTVKSLCATVSLASGAAVNDTITFGRIPAGARILCSSRIYNDDLSSAAAPTLDLGLFNVNSNITDDDDALNDGIALSAAGSDLQVVKDHANAGKKAWEFVSGQTTDPKGEFIVRGTLKDAVTNITGDVTLELYYVVD